jgi:hypothetical protein
MNRLVTRVTAAAGSLALAGAAIVLAAVPAAATLTGGSSSYGAVAPAGLTTAPPQGLAASTGPTMQYQENVDIAGLLTTGLTLDTASTAAAYSRVTSVDAQMSGSGHSIGLIASQVASTCNTGTLTASANLIKPVLTVDGSSIALPAHPTEDESLTFAAGTVTLNDQIPATGGGVEDQAVHIHFTGTSPAQDLYLAVTVCTTSAGNNTITVTNPGAQTNNTGTAITPLQIIATDTDTSQVLTYGATGLPAGLSISPATGLITGTPTTASTGSPFSVTVTVTDTSGASGSATFNWTVHNVVTVTNPGTQSSTQGVPIVPVTMSATDSNGSITTFTWSATGLPTGVSINVNTGVITGTPSANGTFTAHVTATDISGGTNTVNFTWNVAP